MRMIRVQKNSREQFSRLVNAAHVVSVTGDDTGSVFHMPDGEGITSTWPIDAAEKVLNDALG